MPEDTQLSELRASVRAGHSVRLIHPPLSIALSAAFEGWVGKLAEVLQRERRV